jgi:phage shock protein E
MKNNLVLALCAILACLCLSCVADSKKASPQPSAAATLNPYASYEKLAALVSGKDATPFLLLDVRRADEFAAGHIPGAVNLPYDEIAAGKPDVPKDRLVIVYCRTGRRSAIAAESLATLGFTDIADFGGIPNWKGELQK